MRVALDPCRPAADGEVRARDAVPPSLLKVSMPSAIAPLLTIRPALVRLRMYANVACRLKTAGFDVLVKASSLTMSSVAALMTPLFATVPFAASMRLGRYFLGVRETSARQRMRHRS